MNAPPTGKNIPTKKPNLIHTVAFDIPGWRGGRKMAKFLTSSLLRHSWSCDIIVFHNFVNPLFPVERKGFEEIFIDAGNFSGISGGENLHLTID